MKNHITPVQLRWSDLDPNGHPRHSVYYDWGAMCRIQFLEKHGLTIALMEEQHFGPILFREECIFRKEIRLGDQVTIDLKLKKAKRDFSRWTFEHDIVKNDNILSALLIVEGAWMDTVKRKLASPVPAIVGTVFKEMPFTKDFLWLD